MFADCPSCGHMSHEDKPCRVEVPRRAIGPGLFPCLCPGVDRDPSLPQTEERREDGWR